MKLTLFVLTLCLAGSMGATILDLVMKEVGVLIKTDPNLTVDHCSTKCDALFDLAESHDESATDRMCHYACECTIHPHAMGCHHYHASTHAPHTTHMPHHTRPHIN